MYCFEASIPGLHNSLALSPMICVPVYGPPIEVASHVWAAKHTCTSYLCIPYVCFDGLISHPYGI